MLCSGARARARVLRKALVRKIDQMDVLQLLYSCHNAGYCANCDTKRVGSGHEAYVTRPVICRKSLQILFPTLIQIVNVIWKVHTIR